MLPKLPAEAKPHENFEQACKEWEVYRHDARSLYSAVLATVIGIDPELISRTVLDAPEDQRFEAYLRM